MEHVLQARKKHLLLPMEESEVTAVKPPHKTGKVLRGLFVRF
jgi:hypothetical protein